MTASTGAGFILAQPGERLEEVDAALAWLDPADREEEEPVVGAYPRRSLARSSVRSARTGRRRHRCARPARRRRTPQQQVAPDAR